jgi:hypothetical protein
MTIRSEKLILFADCKNTNPQRVVDERKRDYSRDESTGNVSSEK